MKRFKKTRGKKQFKKNKTIITFKKNENFGGHSFELFSVIYHTGDMDKGHYYVHTYDQGPVCHEINDKKVTILDDDGDDTIDPTNAYILFYRKKL